MAAIKRTIVELLVLGIVGLVVAVTANGVRASGSLKWTKDYFKTRSAEDVARLGHGASQDRTGTAQQPTLKPNSADPPGPAPSRSQADDHPDHPYKTASFELVSEVFNDPATASGANVFIDARNDEAYGEGHIPGAVQVDHYHLENYIDRALDWIDGAEKVIVYCNGGECTDSILVCEDLLDFEVPFDKIFLYEAGWTEWKSRDMPIETGGAEEEGG